LYPPKSRYILDIAIPSTFTSQVKHGILKTYLIGQLARAVSIFRVRKIVIYLTKNTKSERKNQRIIELILRYLITPQYLRRKVFPKMAVLKYVGILPPLQTPNHPTITNIEKIFDEFREGIIVKETQDYLFIDVGLEDPVIVRKHKRRIKNKIVVVHLKRKGSELKGTIVKSEKVPYYFKYDILSFKGTLRELLQKSYKEYDLVIGTSRFGNPLEEVENQLFKELKKRRRILIVFGGPKEGLLDIGATKEDFDYFINTIPDQGVRTIRTEEAVFATLSIFNYLIERSNNKKM